MSRIVVLTLWPLLLTAQQHQHSTKPAAAPAAVPATKSPSGLLAGMGKYRHPIQTRVPDAQKFFDQGLNLYYGFNHDEAIRSFERAAVLDPLSPMPWWGKSLALGRNYNRDEVPELEKAAYDALQKALELAQAAPQSERDYVIALAARYSSNAAADHKKLAVAYKKAAGDLSRKYPEDLDAAALYAEAAMNLRPWQLWNSDGTPAEGTPEILEVLESVLRRSPDHPGANHYYIHAVEASPHPERALPSAARLGVLVPAAGHLVHMPAHIYIRTGDHDAAVAANEKAAAADRVYLARAGASSAKGMYGLMYYSHNLHFLVESNMMRGNYAGAKLAAEQLQNNVRPGLKGMPMVESFLHTGYFVSLRFQRWSEVIAAPPPPKTEKLTTAMWHFARGVALAASGKAEEAIREREELESAGNSVPVDLPYGLNAAKNVLSVAGIVLDARIATAKNENAAALELWKKAVAAQDALNYDEPPGWFYPIRESLGGALLRAGQSVEAEKVFREDLARNPRNPRSLFGLAEALKARKKFTDEGWVRSQFEAAWKKADVKLAIKDL